MVINEFMVLVCILLQNSEVLNLCVNHTPQSLPQGTLEIMQIALCLLSVEWIFMYSNVFKFKNKSSN